MKYITEYKIFENYNLEYKLEEICEERLSSIIDIGYTCYVKSEIPNLYTINIYKEDENSDYIVFSIDEIKDVFIEFLDYLNEKIKIISIEFINFIHSKKYYYSNKLEDEFKRSPLNNNRNLIIEKIIINVE
jgi:hypothetical protein